MAADDDVIIAHVVNVPFVKKRGDALPRVAHPSSFCQHL